MEELIERLERATGPDADLDRTIARAVGRLTSEYPSIGGPYTRSIDAALTLVPEGVGWTVTYHQESGAYLAEAGEDWQYEGKTPAIAICIAALRARGA